MVLHLLLLLLLLLILSLQVRGIIWSGDDSRLVSCSMDGSVYEWNVLSAKREKECVLKNCAYTCVSMSPDLKSVYAVGSDRSLKEINLNESQVKSYTCIIHVIIN